MRSYSIAIMIEAILVFWRLGEPTDPEPLTRAVRLQVRGQFTTNNSKSICRYSIAIVSTAGFFSLLAAGRASRPRAAHPRSAPADAGPVYYH